MDDPGMEFDAYERRLWAVAVLASGTR